jgi:hypothetical protein
MQGEAVTTCDGSSSCSVALCCDRKLTPRSPTFRSMMCCALFVLCYMLPYSRLDAAPVALCISLPLAFSSKDSFGKHDGHA